MLICLEVSADAAARTAWTEDVRFVSGYDADRPAPADRAHARARARRRRAVRARRARALTRDAGVRPDGRRADDVHQSLVRRLSRGGRRDAAAEHGAGDQDPAGDRADAPRQRDRRRRDGARRRAAPPRACARARRPRSGTATSTARAPASTGRSSWPTASRSSGRAPESGRSPPTGHRPVQEHEPTLFEIWVCADGYWCDHTKNLCPGELTPEYDLLTDQLLRGLQRRGRALPPRREPRRARPC